MNEPTTLWLLIALAIVAVVTIAIVASRHRERTRRLALQRKFGPEYDRAVEEFGPEGADRELSSRARRVEHLHFRELNSEDRARFLASAAAKWRASASVLQPGVLSQFATTGFSTVIVRSRSATRC